MSRKSRKNEAFDLPSFQMIRAASNGDIEAINAVLKHYEGYIAALSTRKMYDENRQVHYCVDETLRRLQTGMQNIISCCVLRIILAKQLCMRILLLVRQVRRSDKWKITKPQLNDIEDKIVDCEKLILMLR